MPDKATTAAFEEIAKYLSQGLAPSNISIKTGLELEYIDKCIAHHEFDQVFENIDPEAYSNWKKTQAELIAQRRVKTQAQMDAPEHYEKLKQIADCGDLRDAEKAQIYQTLIKMSGAVDKDDVVEYVNLSPGQLDTIKDTLRELDDKKSIPSVSESKVH